MVWYFVVFRKDVVFLYLVANPFCFVYYKTRSIFFFEGIFAVFGREMHAKLLQSIYYIGKESCRYV